MNVIKLKFLTTVCLNEHNIYKKVQFTGKEWQKKAKKIYNESSCIPFHQYNAKKSFLAHIHTMQKNHHMMFLYTFSSVL
jgi:hypothetical protein